MGNFAENLNLGNRFRPPLEGRWEDVSALCAVRHPVDHFGQGFSRMGWDTTYKLLSTDLKTGQCS